MHLNDYQAEAHATAVYPANVALPYLALGLANEAGEVAGKIKKLLRGDDPEWANHVPAIRDELGDVLWYLAVLAEDLGISLEVVAQRNLEKLRDRKARGVLKGNGDNR